jgi:asparagine synthase (glutamine-hydrolysing)
MCGIVGYLGQLPLDVAGVMRLAAAAIEHRGPDDFGTWHDVTAGVAFAHRRLSIQDLSPAGHQPMRSDCGRWTIVFNGEIYNHFELRERLGTERAPSEGGGRSWRGHSDTETLLECIAAWGVGRTLDAADGMFAFGLWDAQRRELHLARDRMGEKPLYYGWVGQGLAFASELKALRVLPGFDAPIDREALARYMQSGAIPAPFTIYRNVFKLPPGTSLVVSLDGVARRLLAEPRAYWSFLERATALHARESAFESDERAVDALDAILGNAVASQMLSDVPLGAFLSGGIDSSTVVALMQARSRRKVQTFSIGFFESNYNEADHALRVARHLGTEHTELYVDDAAAREVIPMLPHIYCEPFADASQIPTYLVAKLARSKVTVSLSGDGGDELFGGYDRYFVTSGIWDRIGWMPLAVRVLAASSVRALSPRTWDAGLAALRPVLSERIRGSLTGDRLHKGAAILEARSLDVMYGAVAGSYWPHSIVLGCEPLSAGRSGLWDLPAGFGHFERMMLCDAVGYLPDDILVKVDRAAMAVSLETRVPMLSRNVVEFALGLPMSLKVRNGEGKWILRRVLDRYVPRELTERPKMGFGVPIDLWLRGPLKDWAAALLDPVRLRHESFLDADAIQTKWREHCSGERNWHYALWPVLMFQAWLQAQKP